MCACVFMIVFGFLRECVYVRVEVRVRSDSWMGL